MSSGSPDHFLQWLSITEETLLLHDGLMRVTDFVELPQQDDHVHSNDESEHEMVSFESKSPSELTERLLAVCGNHNNAYARLLEYRLNALKGFWKAQYQLALEEQSQRENASNDEAIAMLKKHGLWKEPEEASFSTRVSLLLCLPLLQSQSRMDSRLSGLTTELLLNCLRECTPLSLGKEPGDCLNGLESLLSSWLGEGAAEDQIKDLIHQQNAASALVALACARGHLKTFVHTVHLLQKIEKDVTVLPAGDILLSLQEVRGGQGQPTSLLGSKHIVCWGYEDVLINATAAANTTDKEKAGSSGASKGNLEYDIGRSVTTDGKFLFVTNSSSCGLAKLGAGLHGTLRGFSYARNVDLPQGRLAWGNGLLLHRPTEFDREGILFACVIDQCTLQVSKQLELPASCAIEDQYMTVSLCSDGVYFYWMWCVGSLSEKSTRGQSVNLEILSVDAESLEVKHLRSVALVKKEEVTPKSLNESLLSRLRPYRGGNSASALVTLSSGSDSQAAARKDDSNCSMGLPLKTLMRSPMYCDGSNVVLLIASSGASSGSSARSLFGSGAGIAGLRSLATNVCFNIEDGQCSHRADLIDAPTCSLARGAPLHGMGLCFDVKNNQIWAVSADWIDQFFNPGHKAPHHIRQKLSLDEDPPIEVRADKKCSTSEVLSQLLRHIGSMSLHQVNSDVLHSPLSGMNTAPSHAAASLQAHLFASMPNVVLQGQSSQLKSVDLMHFQRVLDILEKAVKESDQKTVICMLVVMQLMFRTNLFQEGSTEEAELLKKTNSLLWSILEKHRENDANQQSSNSAILHEVCVTITVGLTALYPEEKQKHWLLSKLLSEGEHVKGYMHLRDLILVNYAEQLKSQVLGSQKVNHLRLQDELLQLVLKIVVKESCVLLRECQTTDQRKLDQIISSVPMASACLRYLMALQFHSLRLAVLKGEFTSIEEKRPEPDLAELQRCVLVLNSEILKGAYEVLEVLLETCHSIIDSGVEDMEYWLQGLERVSKATLLGHCLPMLVTTMTHPNLRCLSIADALMPQLVQLVVLTSQAALLLKSQVQAIHQDGLLNLGTDHDIADLIGHSSVDLDEEEQGFLAGLKVPAPWTSGKTVESVHPVRDNYKCKETVHIPGARCLYLRFDPRCSSQYDYDKLVVYAGPNTSAKKVAEFGGNTLGFGSRSVLGSGWPKDLVKVDGDTVTFSFEMRSGREHNTPDKAMWGFLVTVRAQESAEEVSQGLPFLADLALGLSVLGCCMLQLLYQGPDKTPDEEKCEALLKSRLLQRCVWQHDQPSAESGMSLLAPEPDIPVPPSSPRAKRLPRIKTPMEIVHKLRDMSGSQAPQIRPSIKEVITPDVLEECILSATIKHLSLEEILQNLHAHEEHQTEEYSLLTDIMMELYRRHHAMLRQLQAIAELEQRWNNEVDDVRQGILTPGEAFFIDYHLVENKAKELAILCFLKHVDFDPTDLDSSVAALSEKLETEVALTPHPSENDVRSFPRTAAIVQGVLERLNLLLHVTIAPESGPGISRSMSHAPDVFKINVSMVRSDTDVLKQSPYTRSISMPSDIQGVQDDSVLDIVRLQMRRQAHRKGPQSILQNLVEQQEAKAPQVALLHQLFAFIGSSPERAVSCESFLAAARTRWKRGRTRQQALMHMIALLKAATKVGGATHLVAAVTSVLQHGPQVDELSCGGMANYVREAFAETMSSVVQLVARYPTACCNSIGLLCVIPYTRAEEKCLVRSGLVQLLDKLCSLTNTPGTGSAGLGSSTSDGGSGGAGGAGGSSSDANVRRQKVSAMAWAGFQVLSNRCVMWEQEDGAGMDDLEHSGLARQVSILLTNHLARATECSSSNQAAGNEALQEVLTLLNNLSRSKMGRAILSQPGCVSKLLSLLLDQRPSPKLVLIILQLCRVALPLMSAEDCEKVELPAWGQDLLPALGNASQMTHEHKKSLHIASLLLAKLGDFLVPGDQITVAVRQSMEEMLSPHMSPTSNGEKDKMDDGNVQDGRLSVYIHKREDQSSHEVIQPLLSSGTTESRPFRLAGGANMEKVVRMDRDITKHGKAEVTTEEAVSALRKAAKWAAMGLVVSTGTPVDAHGSDTNASDKKKMATEVICKEKNAELARTDPIRPFISGHVANNMAAEVIDLLHSLLTAPETLAAQTWASAVETVISSALSALPILLSSIEDMGFNAKCSHDQLITMAKQANAALAALGGFEETVKPGCEVEIKGNGIHDSPAQVLTVSEQSGLATVSLQPPSDDDYQPPRYSDTVQVPVSRLHAPRNQLLPLHQLSMAETIVASVQSLLHPQQGAGSPLSQPLPIQGTDATSIPNQICRVVAEIRTRACKVLACHLRDLSFASLFIQHSSAAIDILKSLAKECGTGSRLPEVESKCLRLRMLYRDCAKPPPPPIKSPVKSTKEITWDTSRPFPPVRSCLFSHALTGVTFLGDPSAGSGLPRGTLVYASQSIPSQAPSFYWELEICSFGDSQDESGPIISFGFMPAAEKRDGAWTNPVGSCLFHNNGRAVHYNGASLLQWRSVRLDVTLSSGDLAGIGWERQGESSSVASQSGKGLVYFTYNGRRLPSTIDEVSGAMFPVVHIQKKSTRIRANFGGRPFAYAEGTQHRKAADECHDAAQDIRNMFMALPFDLCSDSDGEGSTSVESASESPSAGVSLQTPPGPPRKIAAVPAALREYNVEASLHYKLLPCYENFAVTGPYPKASSVGEEESDGEDGEEEQTIEDHYALLVKAWEQKVFPTIRRRFRNEAERKDGLEQIRGALQLGMTDIARQTVEFLYEENGGMPRDLHLPTIDDIKEELAKFTIDRVRKGTTVIVRPLSVAASSSSSPVMLLPKFAVRGMLKTFGLPGTVLDVDQGNELVQVETYLQSEGVLVRFWYPLETLERPPQGYRKSTLVGHQPLDTSSIFIHREVLTVESSLARMHCRTALLELITHCNSPAMEVSATCSTANLGSSMAASAALLQDLDIENLQLLSNELLAPPLPNGGVVASNLVTTPSPDQCLAALSCTLSDVLYKQSSRMREELKVAIARAANQGEDYLIELSNQICMCLQTAPEMFPYDEFVVNENKVSTDVHFPGVACLIVSCKADPKASKKESLYKAPWARIFTYEGHRVNKLGQCSKQEVVCFPRDCSSTSNQDGQYVPAILPTDLIHIKVGISPPPGMIVTIHGIPPQFPLAITYIETLVSQQANFIYRKSDEFNRMESKDSSSKDLSSPWRTFDTIVIPSLVLVHVTKLICGYLWRSDVPANLKESLFHLLAQTLRVLHMGEMSCNPDAALPTLGPQLSSSLAPLTLLQLELRKLFEEESKSSEQNRFSTYFHALMEVCLAVAEVTAPIIPGQSTEAKSLLPSLSTPTLPVPSSPVSPGRRKKIKAKRERTASSSSSKGHHRSESDSSSPRSSSPNAPSTSSSTGSMAKPEEMLWFHRALTLSQIFRYWIYDDPIGRGVTDEAIGDAFQVLNSSSAHCRLLVISGFPVSLDEAVAREAITTACDSAGGLFKQELYLPTHEVEIKAEKSKAEKEPEDASGKVAEAPEVSKIKQLKGYAVVEVRSASKIDAVKRALLRAKALARDLSHDAVEIPEDMICISAVNQSLLAEPQANSALENYLMDKLVSSMDSHDLRDEAMIALTEIFHSCFIWEQKMSPSDSKLESGYICLGRDQIMLSAPGNLMGVFLNNVKAVKKTFSEQISHILRRYGVPKVSDKDDSDKKGKAAKRSSKPSSKEKMALSAVAKPASREKKTKPRDAPEKPGSKEGGQSPEGAKASSKEALKAEEDRLLTLDGFLCFVSEKIKQDVRAVWRALFACGFDLHFERCNAVEINQAKMFCHGWSLEMDAALVSYVNHLCQKLAVSPARLHAHEIYLTEAELSSAQFSVLQGVPQESICLRFCLLQSLNNTLETFFLPLIDLRPALGSTYPRSTACLLAQARGLIFRDTKMVMLNIVLNATAQRKPDQAAPEIVLDPLDSVGGEKKRPFNSNFCQALRQLSSVPSSQLCVRLAAGGDPTYAFNVRFQGEEVHGTSGSFRHFLWQTARELESSLLGLFVPCPSAASHHNRGKYILKPGPMTYAEEKLLIFLGQLLGVTIRADIPYGLDLLPLVWKNLIGCDLDPVTDLQDSDIQTYYYIKKIEMADCESELMTSYSDHRPTFVFNNLCGEQEDLIPKGSRVAVTMENRHQYVETIRALRMSELRCQSRVRVLLAGMSTLIPLQLLPIMTPFDLELRTCGLPHVDLDFLKAHTMYQVGLMESDLHVQYFWQVLRSFSQDELCKFVKFACNQERIPQTCPCRDGGIDTAHVPPYPMKIAPPDGPGAPDSRFIRVETCMFMIKLPQFSTLELMRERLLYAIHCREDPLSG